MLHKLKKQLPKFYTHISTALVVLVLFMLQFVVIEGDLQFYKNADFWASLGIMLAILVVINEIYWRNGSIRGCSDPKYLGSAIEYSIRVNHIKNNNPSLTEDFYSYIDELNLKLYTEARNELLDSYHINKNDYYYGQCYVTTNDIGESVLQHTTPHSELSEKELTSLTKHNYNKEIVPFYSTKQIEAIIRASYGNFKYEKLSASEILSGTKLKNNKFAVHYDGKQNKRNFALSSAVISTTVAVFGAMLGGSIVKDGWSAAALFVFFYRLFMVVWRAIVSDEGGYNDIAETKRTVNINRSSVISMYAHSRNLDAIFDNIGTEINDAKAAINKQLGKEIFADVDK